MNDDDKNGTQVGFDAIRDMAKDAVERGIIDEDGARAIAKNYTKNTESRKIVFKTRAILIKLRKNIIDYWFRYLLLSAGLSGGSAWTFRDIIGQILNN